MTDPVSDDLTARDVIARSLSDGCGEYRDVPIGREYLDMASDAVAALVAAGYTIVTTDSVLDAQYDAKMTAFDGTEEPF